MQTTTHNNIPPGYKYSVVGIIPQEWEVKRIQEICKVDAKSLSAKTSPNYEFEYISLSDVDSDSFDISTSHQIFRTAPSRARRIVSKGDVVISTVRPNLRGFFLAKEDKKDLIASTGFAVLTPTECDSQYLLSCFFSQIVSKQFYSLVVGSNYPAVNSSDVAKLKLAVPPLAEQRKIAEILSVWDEAIEKQSRLIEKLELRKRALMQRLLTGRIQLPGFTTPWQKVKLGEICEEYILRNTEDNDYIVLSCTKYNGLVSSLDYFGKQIFSDNLRTYKVVPKYHFAYATNHIEEGSIGYQGCYDYALISPMYTVFKADDTKVDNYFLYTLLKTPLMIYNYQSRIEGSIDRRGGLRWDAFAGITIKLPYLPEQTAIAEVLKAADNEISTQLKKLDALRLQKRGLMQQLLTGKTRVKI